MQYMYEIFIKFKVILMKNIARFRKVDMAIIGDAAKWKRSGSNSFIWGSVNVSGGSHGSLGTLQSQGV